MKSFQLKTALMAIALAFVSATSFAQVAKHVFIISMDGGKPEVMKQSQMPVTMRLAAEGAVTWEAQTVFPSITLISHTSMLTGRGPYAHKVMWNDWVPQRGLVTVPTIFQLAKKHGGIRTAAFAGKEKFNHLNTPGAIDDFGVIDLDAQPLARVISTYIIEEKPNLCFIHFADSDSAGHAKGWGSPEQMKAFADQDEAMQILLNAIETAGIKDESVIIISADHGGHERTHGTKDPADMTIPWIAWGKAVKKNFAITAPVTTYDTAATALWLLGVEIPSDWDGKPVTDAFDSTAPVLTTPVATPTEAPAPTN